MWSIFPDIVRSSLLAERPPAGASSILSTTFSSSPVLKDFRSPSLPFAKLDFFVGEAAEPWAGLLICTNDDSRGAVCFFLPSYLPNLSAKSGR